MDIEHVSKAHPKAKWMYDDCYNCTSNNATYRIEPDKFCYCNECSGVMYLCKECLEEFIGQARQLLEFKE